MSTNFHWKEGALPALVAKPERHIGKRYAAVRGMGFMWAQPPGLVREVCRLRPNDTLVVDEYGDEYTGQQFITEMSEIKVNDMGSLGQRFS